MATQPSIQWFPAPVRPGCDAISSPLSNAEIENDGTIPPLVHTPPWRDAYLQGQLHLLRVQNLFISFTSVMK